VVLRHDTENSWPPTELLNGTVPLIVDHEVPFHTSASWPVLILPSVAPTPTQKLGLVHDTLLSQPHDAFGYGGVPDADDHVDPSQYSLIGTMLVAPLA
jgi:hypothetical protein